MANTASEPQLRQILDRRKQLKKQRQLRFLRATWRTTVIAGLTAALGWVLIQSEWDIQQSSQISIQGNQKISTQALQQLLPLSYPTSLMQIEPQTLARVLQTRAHIQQATVTRRLFPAHLNVVVQERKPVASTECNRCQLIPSSPESDASPLGATTLWLVDEQGVVLPLETYSASQNSEPLPQLSLANFLQPHPPASESSPQPSQKKTDRKQVFVSPQRQSQWQQMYPILTRSSVKISTVNWQSSGQLVLGTELGQVNMGPYGPQFAAQIRALDRLRSLPNAVDTNEVAYIDLKDPEHPVLEMRAPLPKRSPTQPDN